MTSAHSKRWLMVSMASIVLMMSMMMSMLLMMVVVAVVVFLLVFFRTLCDWWFQLHLLFSSDSNQRATRNI